MKHDAMMNLVLQFEDLEEDELDIARAHLAQCPACRNMLENFQKVEKFAMDSEAMPQQFENSTSPSSINLAAEDLQQANASRKLLLARVGKSKSRILHNPLAWSGMGMAVAASLLLFFGVLGQGANPSLVLDLSLTSPRVHRGTESAPLQAGDAFVVRFTPVETGWPVVVAQKSDGSLKVLSPLQDNVNPVLMGKPVVLPPSGSPFTWRLDDLSTKVWVVISREQVSDPVLLEKHLNELSDSSLLVSYLADHFGSAPVFASPNHSP